MVDYELTVKIEGDGTTAPEEGTHTYTEGTEVDLTAYPESYDTPSYIKQRLMRNLPEFYSKYEKDAEFVEWTGDLSSENETETILIDSDKEVTAKFTELEASVFNVLMEAIGDEIEELMITYQDVLEAHFVDEADGDNLDKVGQMWGLDRIPDESDDLYRQRIKGYAPGFGGGGTLSDLENTLKWYVGEGNYTLTEFSSDITPEPKIEPAYDDDDESWDTNDVIDYHFKTGNVSSVVDVYEETDTGLSSVLYTDNGDGTITVDEDTDQQYLYVEYSFNELTQYGRFNLDVGAESEYEVSKERIQDEINKFKAAGILVTFGAFTLEDSLTVGEDDEIEGHMVDVTYVDDYNVVLEG